MDSTYYSFNEIRGFSHEIVFINGHGMCSLLRLAYEYMQVSGCPDRLWIINRTVYVYYILYLRYLQRKRISVPVNVYVALLIKQYVA